jgi:hypothetical protein
MRFQCVNLNIVFCKLIQGLFFTFTKVGNFTLSKTNWLESLDSPRKLRKLGFHLFFTMALVGIFLLDKIPQSSEWLQFADRRSFAGIPNFANVVSNLLFIWVGACGLKFVLVSQQKSYAFEFKWERVAPAVFFSGVLMQGIVSIWFHIEPKAERLIWEQFPMTFVFMGVFGILIGDRIQSHTMKKAYGPLLFLTSVSAGWWTWTIVNGDGFDLRPYLFAQFFPLLVMLIVLIFFSGRYTHEKDYWRGLLFYACSEFFGAYDRQTFDILKIISGESIGHILIAGGVWQLLLMFQNRKRGFFKGY